MVIEREIDDNGKIILRVINDSEDNFTNLKAFRKDFLSLIGEHEIVKISEHTTVFQTPELYGTDKVFIVFFSDLALFNKSGKCLVFEYNFPGFMRN